MASPRHRLSDLMLLFVGVLFSGLSATPARAGLGDAESSIENDRALLKAEVTVSKSANYTVHTMKSNGLMVKQYVAANGVVFAVTWRGIRHPNVNALLSSYLGEFDQAERPRHQSLRRSSFTTAKLSLSYGGHTRDLNGKAVALDLLPAGMTVEDIR